jgi:hypothetical protein
VFPNPVSNRAVIEYEVTETTDVQGILVDLNGRTVRRFTEKRDLAPGIYQENTDLSDLPPGIYFAKMQTADGGVLSAKMVVARE